MMNGRKGSGGGAGVPRPEDASRESVAVPPGLTLEELQMLNASPMAGGSVDRCRLRKNVGVFPAVVR